MVAVPRPAARPSTPTASNDHRREAVFGGGRGLGSDGARRRTFEAKADRGPHPQRTAVNRSANAKTARVPQGTAPTEHGRRSKHKRHNYNAPGSKCVRYAPHNSCQSAIRLALVFAQRVSRIGSADSN